jgi:hypothetical protein
MTVASNYSDLSVWLRERPETPKPLENNERSRGGLILGFFVNWKCKGTPTSEAPRKIEVYRSDEHGLRYELFNQSIILVRESLHIYAIQALLQLGSLVPLRQLGMSNALLMRCSDLSVRSIQSKLQTALE